MKMMAILLLSGSVFPVRIQHERHLVVGVPFYGSLIQGCMMGSGYAKSIIVRLLSLCGGPLLQKMTSNVGCSVLSHEIGRGKN